MLGFITFTLQKDVVHFLTNSSPMYIPTGLLTYKRGSKANRIITLEDGFIHHESYLLSGANETRPANLTYIISLVVKLSFSMLHGILHKVGIISGAYEYVSPHFGSTHESS